MEQHKPPTPGSWRPGISGNPKGRPPKGSALSDAIRAKVDTGELVDIALALARSGESESTRIAALGWLRDSGYVKPAERHEHVMSAGDDAEEDLSRLSIEELRALDELEEKRAVILARPALALEEGR